MTNHPFLFKPIGTFRSLLPPESGQTEHSRNHPCSVWNLKTNITRQILRLLLDYLRDTIDMIGELLLVHLFTRRVVSYGWPRCMLSCRIFGVKETIEYLKGWIRRVAMFVSLLSFMFLCGLLLRSFFFSFVFFLKETKFFIEVMKRD